MSVGTQGKRLLLRRGPLLIALLLVTGMAGFGTAGYVYSQPTPTATVTEERHRQTVGASVSTSAVVTGNSSLYERNETLRNKPVYLLSASPNLTLTVRTAVPEGVTTEVEQRLVLELRGTKDGEPFWTRERVLVEQTTRADSGRVSSTVTLNVSRLERQLRAAREEVGAVGVFESRLRLNVTYTTDRYDDALVASAPIQISERAYWIDGDLQAQRTESTTVRSQVPRERNPLDYLLPGLLGAGSLAAAAVLWWLYRRLDPTSVRTTVTRSRYEDWISDGEFPAGENRKHVRINSLEDLVDVAIDSNKRVIFDDTYQAYAVADDDLVYYFAEDFDRIETWLDI